MANWKEVLTHMTYETERRMDELRYRLHYALGGPGPIKIVTYRGYGKPDRLYLRGRVVEDKNIIAAQANDNVWENIINMYKRLESDEVPHARLVARFKGADQEVVANEEGFFEVWIEPREPLAERRMWHSVELELLAPIPNEQSRYPVKATAEVLVPPDTARFVVISDIDDTVLRADATHLLRMARNVFLGNAHTRLPFPGVAALYRALFAGRSGHEMNPLFYVSSSPWNLYDLLAQFFTLQEIPIGPVMFLRDWGLNETEILPLHHREYKTRTIRQMLAFYDHLPFLLIGDSGQEDPEIYAEMVRENPERVLAVYIRNVSRDLKRPEAIRNLAKEVVEAGSTLVLADDSVGIARHAIEQGYIAPESMPSIHVEKDKDEAPPNPIEKMLTPETKPEPPTVKVEGRTDAETKEAIKEGAVEDTVKQAGKEETKSPPTVVVKGEEADQNKDPK
jgi:phosphatidate phosphatase APP1